MMKRKRCALLLTAAMALSLAACGANPTSPSANTTPVPTVTPEVAPTPDDMTAMTGGQTIELTLEGDEGTREITATLMDTPAAAEFAAHLPLSFYMTDYANREKHAHMNFYIDDSLLENITVDYKIGDIIYYPPGPTCAMYYDHDGRTIAAGMEVIARMDQEGIDALGSYANDVEVTVSLMSE